MRCGSVPHWICSIWRSWVARLSMDTTTEEEEVWRKSKENDFRLICFGQQSLSFVGHEFCTDSSQSWRPVLGDRRWTEERRGWHRPFAVRLFSEQSEIDVEEDEDLLFWFDEDEEDNPGDVVDVQEPRHYQLLMIMYATLREQMSESHQGDTILLVWR